MPSLGWTCVAALQKLNWANQADACSFLTELPASLLEAARVNTLRWAAEEASDSSTASFPEFQVSSQTMGAVAESIGCAAPCEGSSLQRPPSSASTVLTGFQMGYSTLPEILPKWYSATKLSFCMSIHLFTALRKLRGWCLQNGMDLVPRQHPHTFYRSASGGGGEEGEGEPAFPAAALLQTQFLFAVNRATSNAARRGIFGACSSINWWAFSMTKISTVKFGWPSNFFEVNSGEACTPTGIRQEYITKYIYLKKPVTSRKVEFLLFKKLSNRMVAQLTYASYNTVSEMHRRKKYNAFGPAFI